MNLVDMDEPASDTPKLAGMPRIGYLAKISDILTEQFPIPNPTTAAERVTISEAHVMKTGKKFIRMYCVKNKGSMETKSVGDVKMLEADTEIKYFYPTDEATARGMAEEFLGVDLMSLQPNRSGSQIIQTGDSRSPLNLKSFKIGWGGKSGEDYGIEFVFGHDGLIPRVYDAAIPLEPGA